MWHILQKRGINRKPVIHEVMLKSNYVQFSPDALQSWIKPALLLVENVMLLARWTLSTPTSSWCSFAWICAGTLPYPPCNWLNTEPASFRVSRSFASVHKHVYRNSAQLQSNVIPAALDEMQHSLTVPSLISKFIARGCVTAECPLV